MSDFWNTPAATLPESSTAQVWAKRDYDDREREREHGGHVDLPDHALAQHQQHGVLQWHPQMDVLSDRDIYAHNPSFTQTAQVEPHPKASKVLGDMYGYPYRQPAVPPHQSTPNNALSGLDAYAPLPREYQNFVTGPSAVSLPGFGDASHTAAGQQDDYHLGQWPGSQQLANQQLASVPITQTQFPPVDTSGQGTFDPINAPLAGGFNFQFNEQSLSDLHDVGALEPPSLQFHAPDLTGASMADYGTSHLSGQFAMPSTESYHGYSYDPAALPLDNENIGLAIAGPPSGLLAQDNYSMMSITPGRSEAASSFGKSLSPRTTEVVPHRGRIPSDAKAVLEQHFEQNAYPTKEEVEQLANRLKLKPKTVKNWFGNTRQRRPCSGKPFVLDNILYEKPHADIFDCHRAD